jgi:AraC family transcriptional regulator
VDWGQRLNAAFDYLEETWDREPDLEKAASLAHCSLFHFLRMFEVVSGTTAAEHSRRRRLSRAAIDLAAGKDKVIDIALRYGYETPEAFARAFKRLFEMTPTEARQPGVALQTWPPLRLAMVLEGSRTMKFRIEPKPAFTVTGWTLRTACRGGQNFREIPQFWNDCHASGRIASLVPHSPPLGLIGLCAEWGEDREEFTYLIGVDAPHLPLPGTQSLRLPESTYAVFESIGPMPHAIQAVWQRAFSEWFPSSGYEHAGTPDFEVYSVFPPEDPRGDPSSAEYLSEIWIPLRKVIRSS